MVKKGPYYYAVAVAEGGKPGVYTNWDDAVRIGGAQGKGAVIQKKFKTLEKANAFMVDQRYTGDGSFYAVVEGHKPGVYAEWWQAQEQIKGFSKYELQKFKTEEKAYAYYNTYQEQKRARQEEENAAADELGELIGDIRICKKEDESGEEEEDDESDDDEVVDATVTVP